MKVEELIVGNKEYTDNKEQWSFFKASYEGARKLINLGYLKKNERESDENYEKRMSEAYGFSYSGSIIDLLTYYLFKSASVFELDKIAKDNLFQLFTKDCDLYGHELDDYLIDQQKESSKFGHIGILVDKPKTKLQTKNEEIEKKIYPYLSTYNPLSVLDWKYDKDEYGRPYLSYLKLKEKEDRFRIWTIEKWEVWVLPEDSSEEDAILEDHGKNEIGIIPFVWLQNISKTDTILGISDIKDIAYIDISIMRNLSQAEEIIDYSAFPMMRKPKSYDDDEVGVTAVLEFDPERPEAKPDWLEAECKSPIEAILLWIKRKTEEIYRVVNVGGISAMESSTQVKSGIALKVEFQMLNSKLVKKGKNIASAKYQILKLWLTWQNQLDYLKDISYVTTTSYDVESLIVNLQNALTAKTLIVSEMFNKAIQKTMVREVLPGKPEKFYLGIDAEIDKFKKIESFTDDI